MLGLCLVAIVQLIEPRQLLDSLAAVSSLSIAVAAFAVIVATLLSYLRMRAAILLFGFAPAHPVCSRGFLVGQVSNQLLANVVGQSLSRAAVMRAGGVPFSVSLMATLLERALAAVTLLVASLGAVALLLGRSFLDLKSGGSYLVGLGTGVACALALVGLVLIRRHGAELAGRITTTNVVRGLRVLALTLASHAAMLAAYATVLSGLGVDIWRVEIVGALLVVMFTASLPISFGGWGLRELSAAHALGLAGVPTAAAVTGSILVGVISLAVTLVPAAGIVLQRRALRALPSTGAEAPGPAVAAASAGGTAIAGWDRSILWVLSLLAASLLFFQVRVPTANGEVNLNAADLLAIVALAIAAGSAAITRSFGAPLAWLWRSFALMSAVMLAGLSIGYLNHGWSDWAFMNRGLGWLVLVGYAIAGAAAGNVRGDHGRGSVLLAFAATGIAVCLGQVLLLEIDRFVVSVPPDILAYPLEGFARNRNAFAFQILLLLVALAVLLRTGAIGWRAHAAACGVALVVVWETLSRTGWIVASMLIFVLALNVERIERARFLVRVAAGLGGVLAIYLACSYVLAAMAGADLGGALMTTVNRHEGLLVRPDADGERWQTLVGGFQLWLAHPFTGSGIGGYVAMRAGAGQSFQVIHSVPMWLLAELGLAGLLVFALVAGDWLLRARRLLENRAAQPYAMGLIAILIVLSVAGMAHDFFYQRSFWFLAGLFAAGMTRQASARGAG